MLRTLCLALLLVSINLQAHSENDSLAHRAFWYSTNGQPVLDSSGNCIRNGSWEALGRPSCVTDITEAEPEAVPVPTTEPEPEPAPAAEPTAAVTTEPEATTEVAAPTKAATAVTETEVVMVVADPAPVTPVAKPVVAAEPAPEEPAAVTYSYPTESITAHILFDFDKNNLRIDQQEKIEVAIMQARKAHKIFKVSLDGHADSRGTDEYNYDLSQRRINTIVNYLNLRDMETSSTMAWGESKLILNADGSENYDHSRRVEIKIKVQQKVAN